VIVASALLAAASYGVWSLLDDLLGRGLLAQIASLGSGLAVGAAVYAVAVTFLGFPEVTQLRRLVVRR
jgi:hypothetical protein